MLMLTLLRCVRLIEGETFELRRSSRFYYLAVGLQAAIIGYMVSSFFLSVAYQWYVYYLVGFAVCLRRLYKASDEYAVATAVSATPADSIEKRAGSNGRVDFAVHNA